MQGDGKKDGVAMNVSADWKGREAGGVATSISVLDEIIEKAEAKTPFGVIRQEYAAPLDALVKLAGQNRDVNLLARLHAVISTLDMADGATEQSDVLISQVSQMGKMLRGRATEPKPAAKGIIAGQQKPAPVYMPSQPASLCENLLRTSPSIGDQEIRILQEHGILDVEKLLKTDASDLAKITGMTTNTAFEVKELLRRAVEENAKQDVARRVAELHMINEQLNSECDRVAAANNTVLMNNKNLKNQYPVISEQYNLEAKNFKALQSRVVSARIESNRLSTETGFLKDEHQKLLDLVEEKHLLLDELFRRFSTVRCSFDFVSGETGFAQDMMKNVEGMLNKALMQKNVLYDKIASSEASMEKLFSEFNDIVRKGKTEFYRSI